MKPLHFSELKNMAESPAHCRHYAENGLKQTSSMLKGSAVDAIVFSLATGSKRVLLYPGRRAGKAWEEFRDENSDAYILIESEKRAVYGMAESVARHADACELLKGRQQVQIEWTFAGRACAGTPDSFTEERIVELKTTKSSKPNHFQRDGRHRAYHAQLAWYREGLLQSGLAKPQFAFIVAVESKAPYPVTAFELTDNALDQGERLWRIWFEQYRVCEQANHWPTYVENVVPFDVLEDAPFSLVVDGEDLEVA